MNYLRITKYTPFSVYLHQIYTILSLIWTIYFKENKKLNFQDIFQET